MCHRARAFIDWRCFMSLFSFSTSAQSFQVQTTSRTLRVLVALVAGIFALSVIMVMTIAHRQNQAAIKQEKQLLDQIWRAQQKIMRTDIRDYAFWGEAWKHLHVRMDTDWAYAQENFGPGLYSEYHYEGAFVVDGNNQTRYAVIDGKLSSIPISAMLGKYTDEWLAEARRLNSVPDALVRNIIINRSPAIVVMAPITTGQMPGLPEVAGPPSIMIFINRMTPAKLAALGHSVGIDEARLASNTRDAQLEPAISQPIENGEKLVLRWKSSEPGEALMLYILPLLLLTALVIGFVTRHVSRQAMFNARLCDQRFQQLIRSQHELANSEARFRDVAEASSDWIWEIDRNGMLVYLSARFTDVTGHSVVSWLGRSIDELLHSKVQPVSEWLARREQQGHRSVLRCNFICAQGKPRICRLVANMVGYVDNIEGYRGTVSDITLEVEAQARIQFLSQHDVLTGLPNRLQLKEFLTGRLSHLPESDPLVMISLDLDRFKPINDTWGHAAGDKVLNDVSLRLQSCLGADELAARLGGDEFILLLTGCRTREQIEKRCQRLLNELQRPFSIADQSVFIGASMGIAMAPQDAEQPDELLRLADIALYKAKQGGRNQWIFYSCEMSEHLMQQRDMARHLERAIAENRLRLFYQPRFDLNSSTIAGAEALIRWEPSPGEWIMPDRFIELAEENGLITAISDWVLETACREALSWQETMYVSVNISPVEFRSGNLVQRVFHALHKTGLAPARLELEITENITFENPQHALTVMQGLHEIGVRLTVDDFGTGYASLGYLKAFPFNGLKIDRSWMQEFPQSVQSKRVVEGIMGLAQAFSLTVTAEGIETEEQLRQLKRMSCDEGQGYFLGRPMPSSEFAQLMSPPGEGKEPINTLAPVKMLNVL